VPDWANHAAREEGRYRDGAGRLAGVEEQDARQRQLTRMGNAAGGAGLAYLMAGNPVLAREWFERAVERYRDSFALAPPGSWGRPIAMIKARLLADDTSGAEAESRWTLEQGGAEAESPIARYAATVAYLVLGEDDAARALAEDLRSRADFPGPVAAALVALAGGEAVAYADAVQTVLESFETREEYLEDLPVADTVIVLQAMAERRGLAAELTSPLLPA
jgi:hypothetical protein